MLDWTWGYIAITASHVHRSDWAIAYNLKHHTSHRDRTVSHIEAAKPAKRSLYQGDICDLRTDISLTGNLRFGGLEPLIENLSLERP
jgi:hypothetical protein